MKQLLSWLKDNIGLTVGAIISLGVLGYIYAQVYVNYSKEDEVATQLEGKRGELDSLMRRKPFPHAQNVETVSNTVNILSGADPNLSVARWLTNLASINPPLRNVLPSAFNPMLVQQKNKLLAAAKKYNVAVPPEFGFGFGRYVTQGTPPANDTNQINTLLTQWSAVETFADILFTNRIASITAIRRAPVGAEIPRDANAAALMQPATRGGDEFCGALIRDNPAEIARTLPFELEFTCDTQGLRGILSALESSPRFFIVRSVAVLNSRSTEMMAGGRSEVMGKAAAEAAVDPASAPGAADQAPGSPGAPGAPVPRPAGARAEAGKLAEAVTVFGLEKIQVKLRVDLAEFREPSSSAAK
jgi:hypothetical protein